MTTHTNELLRDERIISVGATDTVVAGGNVRRRCFVISAPPTSTIFVRFAGPAGNQFGLALAPGNLPFVIDEHYVGSALREEVHVISPGGVQNVYFMDLFDS